MVTLMNLTYEELQTLTANYKAAREELGKKLVSIPASIYIYNPAAKTEKTLFETVRDMADENMTAEVQAAHESAMNAVLTFQNLMSARSYEAKMNNYTVSMEMRKLYSEYLMATDIPERLLSAILVINKKTIAPEDHAMMVETYKNLGLTHYSIHTQRDIVYYNSNIHDFHTMKNMLAMHSPSLFQHKYRNFWWDIKDEVLDNDPLTACMLPVINARKS